jgi:hypothetical protein
MLQGMGGAGAGGGGGRQRQRDHKARERQSERREAKVKELLTVAEARPMSANERDLLRLHPPKSYYRAGAPVKASNIRCSTLCEKSMLISWKMSEMDFCIC